MVKYSGGRRVLAALAAGSLVLLTAACSSSGSESQAPADENAPVTLTWWTGQADDLQDQLEALAKEFTDLHPNVTINVSSGASTTDDLLTKLSAGFASDTYPDISYAYGSWATQLSQSGKTLDITDKVAEPDVKWDEFPEAARATATPDGVTIGFPAVVDNLALVYNPDLFAKAGVPVPTNDWSWDDYRSAARALTDPVKKVYGTAYPVSGSEDTTWRFWPMLWQKGGSILNQDQTEATFNSEQGVTALDLLRQMAVEDKSVYLDQTDEKYGPLFINGNIAMIISGPWQLYDLVQAKAPYAVAYLPAFDGSHQTISGPDLWTLFDHQDANRAHWAYELIRWLTSAEVDARWSMANGNLPLRSSEVGTPAYDAFIQEYPGVEVMVDNLANATTPRPTVAGYVGLSEAVGSAISEVLQGAAEPQAALDEAKAKADIALKEG